ncbi:MAG: histidinol-phosphate transaminase [Thiothrix nivea]|nr:MAG: histidinol-phosphate transaminase [Thiothrix nivea]
MSQYWSEIVHTLEPYVPGEQPRDQRYIKLNTNECPYPPSPAALKAIAQAGGESLRLYSDPGATELKQAVAEYYEIDTANVFVGNGSDEVLAHIFRGLLQHDKPLLYPDLSYGFYPVYRQFFAINAVEVPLRDDFSIHPDDYNQENGGIILANPNAPTGLALTLQQIEQLLQQSPDSVVVIDEAYVDFGAESAIALIDQYPNLLVVQTFSKSRSLAGLRVGIAVGDRALIEGLERIKNSFHPYTLGRMDIAGAAAAMRDRAHLQQNCTKVKATRERCAAQLRALGFTVLPSSTNFLFVRPPEGEAEKLYQQLKAQGILVRYFNKPRIKEYLRITIGTDEEMNILIAKLRELPGGQGHG